VSIGLAASVPGSTEKIALMDLYRLADEALYEAKRQGRNRTCCAKPLAGETAQPARVLQLVTVAT
jgi:PleD family two-component response regulator